MDTGLDTLATARYVRVDGLLKSGAGTWAVASSAGRRGWLIGIRARDTSVWTDDVWRADSTRE